ncbi:DNA-binding protein [Butyrivibrio sp. CB08]|uniref:helix-turn-helix domain-containing protein n=1 Tax=Butyrivibrio sp. CB08 TaxID=2364879 RepID=UPI000EA86DC0|nr:helix-turn-helix domain-containing protein [Butyrivibrio sp. CB08]RKM56844.1 DNA-binding protein [Butyrivibrio sp. CB08]
MKKSVTYIDTETAAAIFGVTKNTVTNYCRKDEIKGCKKDDKGRWLIPVDSIKPLTKKEKITALQGILIVKNNPNERPQWLENETSVKGLELSLKYLFDNGYICNYKQKRKNAILKIDKIQLTNKGMDLALGGGGNKALNVAVSTFKELLNLVTPIASLYLQYKSLR